MATRVFVYSPTGVYLAEILCHAVVSWKLNTISTTKVTVPKSEELNDAIIRYGNLVRIVCDQTGDFGGVMITPVDWDVDSITLTAYSGDWLLRKRRPSGASIESGYYGTAGSIFSQMIADANLLTHTGITLYEYESAGGSWAEPADAVLYDILLRICKQSGQDYAVDPYLDPETGLFGFRASWYQARGTTHNFTLREGRHLAEQGGVVMSEQGEVVNDLLLRGFDGRAAPLTPAFDASSQFEYTLQQDFVTQNTPVGLAPAEFAKVLMSPQLSPRRTFNLVVVNEDSCFDYLGIGDEVGLKMLRYGFSGSGLGLETNVRVLAREFDETTGKMSLVVDEVST